jgi:hypothetical protein
MEGIQDILLEAEDAETFYRWVANYWQSEFERDLQNLCESPIHGALLSTWMPLVTFREGICCRGLPKQEDAISALMERLRVLTREWRAAGVDTVYFHACKRQDGAEPFQVDPAQQFAPVVHGESLNLPARRPAEYPSPRTRDASNECIDATTQLNANYAEMAANARRYEKIRWLVGKDQLTLSIEHDCYTQYVDSGEELDGSIDNLLVLSVE